MLIPACKNAIQRTVSVHNFIRENFQVVPYRAGALRGQCFAPFRALDLTLLPWDTLREQPQSQYRLEKATHTRRVISFLWNESIGRNPSAPIRLYAKRARIRSVRKSLLAFLRPSRARKEFHLGLRMLHQQIPSPLPVMHAERRVLGFLRETYLVTVELENARPFSIAFAELGTSAAREAALRELAAFLKRTLEQGFLHVDCEAEHIFVEGDPSAHGACDRMSYIDVDGGRMGITPSPAVKKKVAFQIFRSMNKSRLSRKEKTIFCNTLFDRHFEDNEIDQLLQRLDLMENWTVRRKALMKALRLKRRS